MDKPATEPAHVYFGPRKIDVWPKALQIYDAGDPADGVQIIPNLDILEIQQPLIDAILQKDACERITVPRESRANGGQRIRNLDAFGIAALTLLNERAMALLRRVTCSPTAAVDDCRANVFRDGEYTLPHAQRRAMASIVYALEPGDVSGPDSDPMKGELIMCDTRLKSCGHLERDKITQPSGRPASTLRSW